MSFQLSKENWEIIGTRQRMHFWHFLGNSDSEWALFECLYETGLKFLFQKICEKVKSDFKNRNKI